MRIKMISTDISHNKTPFFIKILVIYYRIFGLSIGGLTITKDNECKINKYYKYFGHILTLFILIIFNWVYILLIA